MQQTAIQGVPPQQWPANSSLAMFQHPTTAQTWNPFMMSFMLRPATQLTTQPSQLAAQMWNPAMLPSAPQTDTQPSPFAGPMWTPTTISMMQQPATQTTVQQPATQPTTQQPPVRIWNPAMRDTTAASQSSFKPVTPAVDQGGAVGNQTVTLLTMGLDSSPRGSVSRASIGSLPTTPALEREVTPINASVVTAILNDTSKASGASAEHTSQLRTLNQASQESSTSVEETEAAELADPSEVV